ERAPLGPAAELARAGIAALAAEQAEPRAPADEVDEPDYRVGVAPLELDPTGRLLGDDPVLVALHGECDDHARRDRVEHVLDVELVDQRERVQIAHAAQRPGGGERLVLGPAVLRRHAELLHLDLALAG